MRKLLLAFGVLGILLVVYFIANASYLSAFLVDSLVISSAPLVLAAFGELCVLLAGGIDLSIGSVMSLTTVMVASGLVGHGWVAIFAGLAVGLLTGAANGWLCAMVPLPDLIVTLATSSIASGFALLVMAEPGGTVPLGLVTMASGEVAGVVPWALVVLVAVGGTLAVVLHRTALGKHIIASGATQQGAKSSGVRVGASRSIAYVIGGLLGSLGGLMLAGLSTSGDATIGAPYTLEAIAAAVVGGVSLFGGEGTVSGAAAGAMILSVIAGILTAITAPEYLKYVISGAVLVVAVAVTVPATRRAFRMPGIPERFGTGGG